MRIAFLTLSLRQNGGGSHQNAITFIRALRSRGHTVNVYVFEESDPPQDIEVNKVSAQSASFLSSITTRADYIRDIESKTDVFFCYGHSLMWAAGRYRMKGEKPVAVYIDSHLDSMKEQGRFSMRHRIGHRVWEMIFGLRMARHVDQILAVSPYLKGRLEQAGFPSEKIAVVPNAFDFSEIVPKKAATDTISILFVGRLSPEKGADVLIDALAKLPSEDKWQLTMVGDGPERQALENKIRSNSLANRVRITGWQRRETLVQEYSAADIFVLPSRVPEPFGRSLVEALHAGLPAIVPERGGATWVAGGAGLAFRNNHVDSLASALVSLLRDSERRLVLAAQASEQAARFDVEKVGKTLSETLAKISRKA